MLDVDVSHKKRRNPFVSDGDLIMGTPAGQASASLRVHANRESDEPDTDIGLLRTQPNWAKWPITRSTTR